MEYFKKVAELFAKMELCQFTPSAEKALREYGAVQCYETLDVSYPVITALVKGYDGSETAESLGLSNVGEYLQKHLFEVSVSVSDCDSIQEIADKYEKAYQAEQKQKWVKKIREVIKEYQISSAEIWVEDNSSIH